MNLTLKKGQLLISTPYILNDFYFQRSIILLTEYSKNGSVGFIINKPLKLVLSDIIPNINCNFNVYQGGPVEQDNLYFIHKIPHLIKNSIKISEEIYWGGNFEELKTLLNKQVIKPNEIRFFLGYSGWEREQLEKEIITKSWFITKNSTDTIFNIDEQTIWRDKLLQKGGVYKIWANAPDDIQMN